MPDRPTADKRNPANPSRVFPRFFCASIRECQVKNLAKVAKGFPDKWANFGSCLRLRNDNGYSPGPKLPLVAILRAERG